MITLCIMFGSRNTTGATRIPDTAPTADARPQPRASIQPHLHADQFADLRVEGRSPHRKAQLGEVEEKVDPSQDHQADGDDAHVLDRDQDASDLDWPGREGRGERLGDITPDHTGQGVYHREEGEGHDHHAQLTALLERPDDDPFDQQGPDESERHRDDQGQREWKVKGDQKGPADEGCEHRKLALREVDQPHRAVDQDQGQGEAGVDAAGGEPGYHLGDEVTHQGA